MTAARVAAGVTLPRYVITVSVYTRVPGAMLRVRVVAASARWRRLRQAYAEER